MHFELMNTLSGKHERVFASDGKAVRFYACGPTVYGPAHIGNFRTFVLQDIFRRICELSGMPVLHVRNVTDIDDKTIRQSQMEDKPLEEFTEGWREKFEADCGELGLLEPHHSPSAVAHIPEQIALIERLMEGGLAYQGEDDSVYFRISAFPGYGKLSRLDQRELRAGAAETAHEADEYDKESVADFVIWKAWRETDGPNAWDSPWGRGRPGWHLECSAMSLKYLGQSFDVHGGGVDLCFPHHENEIAQAEGATGQLFARHWFHTAHLLVNGTKMSKSLGNLYTLDQLKEQGFTAGEVRYLLLSAHYRKQLNFTHDGLHSVRQALMRLAGLQVRLGEILEEPWPDYESLLRRPMEVQPPFQDAWGALHRDLNTAEALGNLFTGLKFIEAKMGEAAVGRDEVRAWRDSFARIVHALGLILPVLEPLALEIPEEIEELARQRWWARQARDWTKADDLRDILLAKGWQVKDAKDCYELTPRCPEAD